MTFIDCKGLTKSFFSDTQETKVLRGVDLKIEKAEFMMIVGPSGCGKTTLISIIAGILKQDLGVCSVEGHFYSEMSRDELMSFRSKYIGFIFQSFNLIPTLTVAQNVAIPLIINGQHHDEAVQKAHHMLTILNLGEKGKLRPNQLSVGEQQRVAIARSLIHAPSLLICDEPTSALDYKTGEGILELMKGINKSSGTTFVVVTHDSRIFKYADRIAYMNDGIIEKVIANG